MFECSRVLCLEKVFYGPQTRMDNVAFFSLERGRDFRREVDDLHLDMCVSLPRMHGASMLLYIDRQGLL